MFQNILGFLNPNPQHDYKLWKNEYRQIKEYLTPRLKIMNQDDLSTLFAQWNQYLQPSNINDHKEGIEEFSNRILLSNLYDFFTQSPSIGCYSDFELNYDTNSVFLIRIIMKSIQLFDQHSNTPAISFASPLKTILKWFQKNDQRKPKNAVEDEKSPTFFSFETANPTLNVATSCEDPLVSFSSETNLLDNQPKHENIKKSSKETNMMTTSYFADKKLWMNIVYIMKSMKRYIPEKLAGVIRTYTHCIFQIAYNLDGNLQQILIKTLLFIENYEGPSLYVFDHSNRYLLNPSIFLQKPSQIYMISVFLERYLQYKECDIKNYIDLIIEYFLTVDTKYKSDLHNERIVKENSNFYLAIDSFFNLFIKLDFPCYDIQKIFDFLLRHPSQIIYEFFIKYHSLIDMSIFDIGKFGFNIFNDNTLICGQSICRFKFMSIIMECVPDFDIQKLFNLLQLDKHLQPSHICIHFITLLKIKPELMTSSLKQHIYALAHKDQINEDYNGSVLYLIVKLKKTLFSDFVITDEMLSNYPSLQLRSLKWIENDNERNDKLLQFILIDSNATSKSSNYDYMLEKHMRLIKTDSKKHHNFRTNLRVRAIDFLVPTEQLSKNSVFYSLLYDYSFKVRNKALRFILLFNDLSMNSEENPKELNNSEHTGENAEKLNQEINYHDMLTDYLEYIINSLTNAKDDIQFASKIAKLLVFFSENIKFLGLTSYSTILIDLIISFLSQRYSIISHSANNLHLQMQSGVLSQQYQSLSFVSPPSSSILTMSNNIDENEFIDNSENNVFIFSDSSNQADSLSPPETSPNLYQGSTSLSPIPSQASSTTLYQQETKTKSKTLLKDHVIKSINEEFYLKRDKYLLKVLSNFGELCNPHLDKILQIFYSILKIEKNENFLYKAITYLTNLAFTLMPTFNLSTAKPELQIQLIDLLKNSTLMKLKISILKLMGSCFDYIRPSPSKFGKSVSTSNISIDSEKSHTTQSMVDTIFQSLMSNDFENHWFGMKILAVIFENEYQKASKYAFDFAQKIINFLTVRSNSPHNLYQYLTLVLVKCPNDVLPNLLPEIQTLIEQKIYEKECIKMCISICDLVTKSGNDIIIGNKTYAETDNLSYKFMEFITQTFDLVLQHFLNRDEYYFKWAIRFISLSIVNYNLSVDSFFRYLSKLITPKSQNSPFRYFSNSAQNMKSPKIKQKENDKPKISKPYLIETEIIHSFIYLVQNLDMKLYISSIITLSIILQNQTHFAPHLDTQIENNSRKEFGDALICLYKSLIVYQNYNIQYNFLLKTQIFQDMAAIESLDIDDIKQHFSKSDLRLLKYKRNIKTIELKYVKKDNFFIDLFPIETENTNDFTGRLIYYTFLYSPNPIYRSFSDYIQSIWRLACRIFPPVFLSLWEQCSIEDRNHFSAILNSFFQKKNLNYQNHESMELIEYLDIQGYTLNIDYMKIAQITSNYYYSFIIIQRYFIDHKTVPISIFPKIFQICQKSNQKSTFRALFQIFENKVDQITAGDCYSFLGNWDHALQLYENSDAPLPKRLVCLFSLRRYSEIVEYYEKLDSLVHNRKEKLQSLNIFLWAFSIRRENTRIEELLKKHHFLGERNFLYPQIIYYITTQNYDKAIELIDVALQKLIRYDFEKGDMYNNQKKKNKLQLLCEFDHVINTKINSVRQAQLPLLSQLQKFTRRNKSSYFNDISEIWNRFGYNFDRDTWMWQQLILARSLLKPINSNQMSYLPMISALRKSGHFDIIHQYFDHTLDQITKMPIFDERLKLEWDEGFNIDSYLEVATTLSFGLIKNIYEWMYLVIFQKLPLPAMILNEFSTSPMFGSDLRDYISDYFESISFENAMHILQEQTIVAQRNFFSHLATKFPEQMFLLYMKTITLHNNFAHLCQLTGKFASKYDTQISYRYYNAARKLESEKIANWKGWAMANLALFMENLSRMNSPVIPSSISGSYAIGNEQQESSILTNGSLDAKKMQFVKEQQRKNYQRTISMELGDLDIEEDEDDETESNYDENSDDKPQCQKSKLKNKFEKRIDNDMGTIDSQSSSENDSDQYNNSSSESQDVATKQQSKKVDSGYHQVSSNSFDNSSDEFENTHNDKFFDLDENHDIQIDSADEYPQRYIPSSISPGAISDPIVNSKGPFDNNNSSHGRNIGFSPLVSNSTNHSDANKTSKNMFDTTNSESKNPIYLSKSSATPISTSSDLLKKIHSCQSYETVQTIDIADKILNGEADEIGRIFMLGNCESYDDIAQRFSSVETSSEGNETVDQRRDLLNECSAEFANFLSRNENYPGIDPTIEYETGRKLGLDLIEACLKIVEYDGKFSFEYLVLLFFALFTITSNGAPCSRDHNPYGPFQELEDSDTTDSEFSNYRYHDDDGHILPKKLEYRVLSLPPKMIVDMLPQISIHINTDTALVEKLYICAAHEDFQSVFFSLNVLSKSGSKRATAIIDKLKSFRSFSRFESNVADINNNLRSAQFPSINKAVQMRQSRARMPVFSLPYNSASQLKGYDEAFDNSISLLIEECMLFDEGLVQLSQSIFERWLDGLETAPKSVFNCDNILLSLFKDTNNPSTDLDKMFVKHFGEEIHQCEELFKKHSNATLQEMWIKLNRLYKEINNMMNHLNYVTLKEAAPILSNHSFKAIQIPGHHKSKTATVTRRLSQISNLKQIYSLDSFTKFTPISSLSKIQDPASNLNDNDQNVEYLSTIEEKVEVVASSQRPKCIVFNSTSGSKFKFLLKSNEDLRIDQRIMQFFSLVNTFLHKTFKANDNDTQKKSPMLYTLDIKVYTILPLRKNCGLISFVNNSESFFNLVEERRKINGQSLDLEKNLDIEFTGNSNSFKLMNNLQKYEFFNFVAENTKANEIFETFFHKSLSTSEAIAKMRAFAKSLGLMSMIGHVIGLGDRHPSNILIDLSNGSVIHIDFADCFEVTQKRSDFPEKVPFRLTRMFINALECNTSSGEFEDTSIAVMKLMRKEKASLAAQLAIFLMESQKDKTAIERIIDKLSGKEFNDDDILFEKEKESNKNEGLHSYPQTNLRNYTSPRIALSVEDQVHKLIAIAQDPINYCCHFPGWCPFW